MGCEGDLTWVVRRTNFLDNSLDTNFSNFSNFQNSHNSQDFRILQVSEFAAAGMNSQVKQDKRSRLRKPGWGWCCPCFAVLVLPPAHTHRKKKNMLKKAFEDLHQQLDSLHANSLRANSSTTTPPETNSLHGVLRCTLGSLLKSAHPVDMPGHAGSRTDFAIFNSYDKEYYTNPALVHPEFVLKPGQRVTYSHDNKYAEESDTPADQRSDTDEEETESENEVDEQKDHQADPGVLLGAFSPPEKKNLLRKQRRAVRQERRKARDQRRQETRFGQEYKSHTQNIFDVYGKRGVAVAHCQNLLLHYTQKGMTRDMDTAYQAVAEELLKPFTNVVTSTRQEEEFMEHRRMCAHEILRATQWVLTARKHRISTSTSEFNTTMVSLAKFLSETNAFANATEVDPGNSASMQD
jgi:hypothetical protein